MPEPALHLPNGLTPLQQRVHREKISKQPQELTLPEVHAFIGRDLTSSGLTIYAWEPTGGDWPAHRSLYAARWLAPVLTTEGALRMLAKGAAAAVAELFGPELPS